MVSRGHVLVASRGYERSDIYFDHVTAIVGRCIIEVRKIAQVIIGCEPWVTDNAMPALDASPNRL